MAHQITAGAVPRVHTGYGCVARPVGPNARQVSRWLTSASSDTDFKPVVQVVDVKKLPAQGTGLWGLCKRAGKVFSFCCTSAGCASRLQGCVLALRVKNTQLVAMRPRRPLLTGFAASLIPPQQTPHSRIVTGA